MRVQDYAQRHPIVHRLFSVCELPHFLVVSRKRRTTHGLASAYVFHLRSFLFLHCCLLFISTSSYRGCSPTPMIVKGGPFLFIILRLVKRRIFGSRFFLFMCTAYGSNETATGTSPLSRLIPKKKIDCFPLADVRIRVKRILLIERYEQVVATVIHVQLPVKYCGTS